MTTKTILNATSLPLPPSTTLPAARPIRPITHLPHPSQAIQYLNTVVGILKRQTVILRIYLAFLIIFAILTFVLLGLWLCARRRLRKIAASEARASREHGGWVGALGGGGSSSSSTGDAIPLRRRDGVADCVEGFDNAGGKGETWSPGGRGGWSRIGRPTFVNGRLGWMRDC